MKVSLNWLRDYLPLPQSHEEISDILTALGLEAFFDPFQTHGSNPMILSVRFGGVLAV